MILLSQKVYAFGNSQLSRQDFGGAAVRTIAHHQKVRRNRLANARQNMHAVEHPLHRPKIRKMNQQFFAARGKRPGARFFRIRLIDLDVDEVRNDAHFVLHSKDFRRPLADELADAGHAVRFLNRKFGNWKVRAVRPHQRDVRPVQRGNERKHSLVRQHLLRQQRRDRVRNGVVHVQQVERVALGHFRHSRGQRQAVRRILEQRIIRNFHLVIMDARDARIEANRV